eukprot:COSAG06_NODE_22352_length_726_cov_1.079745_1_plen_47_part_10
MARESLAPPPPPPPGRARACARGDARPALGRASGARGGAREAKFWSK